MFLSDSNYSGVYVSKCVFVWLFQIRYHVAFLKHLVEPLLPNKQNYKIQLTEFLIPSRIDTDLWELGWWARGCVLRSSLSFLSSEVPRWEKNREKVPWAEGIDKTATSSTSYTFAKSLNASCQYGNWPTFYLEEWLDLSFSVLRNARPLTTSLGGNSPDFCVMFGEIQQKSISPKDRARFFAAAQQNPDCNGPTG